MRVQPDVIARFLVTAFFAIVFLQSSLDKLLDSRGNVAYFRDQFKSSAIPPVAIPILFWLLTALEMAAGIVCAIGIVSGDFATRGLRVAATGVLLSGFALLCLLLGQRLAKDYAGAAVVAAYFAVALIGAALF